MEDPRPRNRQGQFAQAALDGMDPSSMQAAYHPGVAHRPGWLDKLRQGRSGAGMDEAAIFAGRAKNMSAKVRLKELAAYGENNQTLQKWLKAQGHHFKGKVHVNYGWSGGKDSTMHKVYSPRFKTEDDRLTVNETPNGEMKIYQGMNYRSPLHVIPAKQAKNMNAKMRLKELAAATSAKRPHEDDIGGRVASAGQVLIGGTAMTMASALPALGGIYGGGAHGAKESYRNRVMDRFARRKGFMPNDSPMGAAIQPIPKKWQADGVKGVFHRAESARDYVRAHEVGHVSQNPKWGRTAIARGVFGNLPIVAGLGSAMTSTDRKNDKTATGAALLGTAAAAPVLANEVDASVRGYNVMRKMGSSRMRAAGAFIGLPSYVAASALPAMGWAARKARQKNQEKNMNAKMRLKELAAATNGLRLKEFKNQDPKDNWKRAAGVGFLAGGPLSAIALQPNASDTAKAGLVYKKRNALADSVRLTTGAAGGAIAGVGSVLGYAALRKRTPNLPIAQIAGNLGSLGGLGGGYAWGRSANRKRIEEQKRQGAA